jgi:hypothetical protein
MIGIARKKENSTADRLSPPSNSAPTIVAPDRDVPCIMARHRKKPMQTAIGQE